MEEYGLLVFCGVFLGVIGIIEAVDWEETRKDSKRSFAVRVYRTFKNIAVEFKISKRNGYFEGFPCMEKVLESYAMLLEEVQIDFVDVKALQKQLLIINDWENNHNVELQEEFERSIATKNPIKEIYKEKENAKELVLNAKRKQMRR